MKHVIIFIKTTKYSSETYLYLFVLYYVPIRVVEEYIAKFPLNLINGHNYSQSAGVYLMYKSTH